MGYDAPSSKRAEAYRAPPTVKPPNRWPRRILLAVLALAAGGYLAANPDFAEKISTFTNVDQPAAGGRGAGRGPGRGGGAAPVRVAQAQTRDVEMTAHTLGTVLANSVVTIKSQIDGPLLAAGFREGQLVKKGDLLFRIDPAPFEAALRQSLATVARDQAQYASAQADADRAVMLADRGIVSAQQRDQLVANAKALAATIEADKAAAERAQLLLGYTTIRSPIDGKTGPYIVFPGNQVHANDAAGLIIITEIQPVKITFNLPQGELPQLQDRLQEGSLIARVMARSDVATAMATAADNSRSEKEIPVKVNFIDNAIDARTGTIELRATFDNPDLRLVPGELVDVSVNLETLKQVVTVPREAINVGQSGNYVFVVDDSMKAQMQPVTVLYQDQQVAAISTGVKEGDRVVVDGQLRLTPGAGVLITQPPGQPQATEGLRQLSSGAPDLSAQETISKSGTTQSNDATPAGRRGGGARGAGRNGG